MRNISKLFLSYKMVIIDVGVCNNEGPPYHYKFVEEMYQTLKDLSIICSDLLGVYLGTLPRLWNWRRRGQG